MPKISVDEALIEGNWIASPWSPRIADDTEFQAWIGTLVDRASAYLAWRVGAANYGETAEPQASVLKQAEMHLCQEQLLLSAAEVADSASGSVAPPFSAAGAELRAQAQHRRARAEELIAPYDQGYQAAAARPRARLGESTPALRRRSPCRLR